MAEHTPPMQVHDRSSFIHTYTHESLILTRDIARTLENLGPRPPPSKKLPPSSTAQEEGTHDDDDDDDEQNR